MTPEILALTTSLEAELVTPPLGADGLACPICRDWMEEEPLCRKCQSAVDQLGHDLTPVVPISLYVKPSSMRDRLTFYKDDTTLPGEAARLGREVAAIIERFFEEHGSELAGRYGDVDGSVIVPTKHRETERHPLAEALDRLPALAVPPRENVLRLGSEPIGRRTPSTKGYVAREDARGRRYVLIDDVYTTGATAQSAAHALRAGGAVVSAIVVVGRRLNPDRIEAVAELVERQRATPFSFTRSPWA